MFTGLVETTGQVVRMEEERGGRRLLLHAAELSGLSIGESISVCGVCLTLVSFEQSQQAFQIAPETLRKTTLGTLKPGDMVNLERAMKLGDRFGGHWVQGHVDGIGTLLERKPDADWEMFVIGCPAELTRYMVPKGSICMEGVSLTIVSVEKELFSVSLIPHTLQVTNLGKLKQGSSVNLEVDILAKYVEKLVAK